MAKRQRSRSVPTLDDGDFDLWMQWAAVLVAYMSHDLIRRGRRGRRLGATPRSWAMFCKRGEADALVHATVLRWVRESTDMVRSMKAEHWGPGASNRLAVEAASRMVLRDLSRLVRPPPTANAPAAEGMLGAFFTKHPDLLKPPPRNAAHRPKKHTDAEWRDSLQPFLAGRRLRHYATARGIASLEWALKHLCLRADDVDMTPEVYLASKVPISVIAQDTAVLKRYRNLPSGLGGALRRVNRNLGQYKLPTRK